MTALQVIIKGILRHVGFSATLDKETNLVVTNNNQVTIEVLATPTQVNLYVSIDESGTTIIEHVSKDLNDSTTQYEFVQWFFDALNYTFDALEAETRWEYSKSYIKEYLSKHGINVVGNITVTDGYAENGLEVYKVTINGNVIDIPIGIKYQSDLDEVLDKEVINR